METSIKLYTRVNLTFGHEKFKRYNVLSKFTYTLTTNKKLIGLQNILLQHE